MRLLVVEDEEDLVDALASASPAGYAVDVAYDAPSAHEKLRVNAYDLVLLDLNLPDGDGLQLCRTVTARPAEGVRILMLTARDPLDDRVAGLDEGADDYLVKPFSFAELLGPGPGAAAARRRAHHLRVRVGRAAPRHRPLRGLAGRPSARPDAQGVRRCCTTS